MNGIPLGLLNCFFEDYNDSYELVQQCIKPIPGNPSYSTAKMKTLTAFVEYKLY